MSWHAVVHVAEVLGICFLFFENVSFREILNQEATRREPDSAEMGYCIARGICPRCTSHSIRDSLHEGSGIVRCNSCEAGYIISYEPRNLGLRASFTPDTRPATEWSKKYS